MIACMLMVCSDGGFPPPFGTLYLAYTSDSYEAVDEILLRETREKQNTFFIKMTFPVEF